MVTLAQLVGGAKGPLVLPQPGQGVPKAGLLRRFIHSQKRQHRLVALEIHGVFCGHLATTKGPSHTPVCTKC